VSTLRDFAERHRLRVRRCDDGTADVPGRDGALYRYDRARLAVLYLDGTPRAWGHRRRACIAAGMELVQDGDAEGALLFDPSNDAQAGLAIKVARVKRRRVPSEAQLAVLARAREASPLVRTGLPSAQNRDGAAGRGSGQGSEVAA
jgi:hypothetical protein